MKVFTTAVGDHGAPLTSYVLEGSPEMATTALRPGILVLPGGGYAFTSDREAEPVAMAYLAEGFNACVLRYSTGSDAPWEQSYADGTAALAWMREHAAELAIDPDRIAVVGFSAGGHLAASLGANDAPPAALVLGYPVTLEEFGPLVGKEILDVPSAVTPDYPPTFLFSTSGDTLVPIRNSVNLLAALAEHGVPFESHIYLLGPHGISLAKPVTASNRTAMVDTAVQQWLVDSVRFLHRVLGDFATEGEAETFGSLVGRRRFGLTMPVGRLLADPLAGAVVEQHLSPDFAEGIRANRLAAGLPLVELASWHPETITPDVLSALARDLEPLNES